MIKPHYRIHTFMRFIVIKITIVLGLLCFEYLKGGFFSKALYVSMQLSITNTYTGSVSFFSSGITFVGNTGYTTGNTHSFAISCSTGCSFQITGDIEPPLLTGITNSGVIATGSLTVTGSYGIKYIYASINRDREILPLFVFILQYQETGFVPPPPTATGSVPSGGSLGGRGSLALFRDSCPRGDWSPSYYDRSCGEGFLGSAPMSGGSFAIAIQGSTRWMNTGNRINPVAYTWDPCLLGHQQPDQCTYLKQSAFRSLKTTYSISTIKQRLKYLTALYNTIDGSSRVIVTHRTLRTFLYNKLRRKPEYIVRKTLLGLEQRLLSLPPQNADSYNRFRRELFIKELRFVLRKKVP